MAGINGFGANYNKGINVGGLNQSGNAKNTQQAKNELTELKLNTNQVDGFVKSNNAEQTREEDKPKFDEGGDGAKGKGNGKSFWENFNNRRNKGDEDKAQHPYSEHSSQLVSGVLYLCQAAYDTWLS